MPSPSRLPAPALAAVAVLAAALLASACRGERSAPGGAEQGSPGPSCGPGDVGAAAPPSPHLVASVQLGAFGDSSRAAALRDSLVRQGWVAYVHSARGDTGRAAGGAAPWRVRIAPTVSVDLAQRIAFNLRQLGREAVVVRDTVVSEMPTRAVVSVSAGSRGMTARVRWARSRDRCSLLVVHDPVAVENDPLPNVFVFVSEWGPIVLRRDSVWDVAPDPEWERIAFSRAYVVSAGGRDSLSAAEWQSLARRTGASVEAVRSAAFPTSGMALAYGVAQPAVLDVRRAGAGATDSAGPPAQDQTVEAPTYGAALAALPATGGQGTREGTREGTRAPGAGVRGETTQDDSASRPGGAGSGLVTEHTLPTLGGWRIGWSRDGRALALGGAPPATSDDAPSTEWQLVDPATGAALGASPRPAPLPAGDTLAAVRWREGPVLDVSVPVDLARRRGLTTSGYRIETRGGWIHLTAPGTRRGVASRVIGPGVALAATAHARFILALVPREGAQEYESPLELVVYQVDE